MIKDKKKRYCNKPNCMSDAEIMGILILLFLFRTHVIYFVNI